MAKMTNVEEMIKLLQKSGYRVERERNYIKHTFEIESDLLRLFFDQQTKRKIKVKEAINEAIQLWLTMQSKRS